jgi:hypothetical protein
MTRRERLEAKLAKREEWAQKRQQQGNADVASSIDMVSVIPMGQPILVGHHSEKGHRALLARSDNAMRRGCEGLAMAKHHEEKAAGLEHQLDHSIFSDDEDATDRLNERIAELEASRDEMKKANAYWRKHKSMKGFPGLSDETAAKLDADIPTRYSWCRQPYSLTNLGANIRRLKERLKTVARVQQRTEAAQDSDNGVWIAGGDYVTVTFAEKPARSVLDALKAAGFRWGQGSWHGKREALPAEVIQ